MSAERWIPPNNTLDVFKSFYGEIANLPFFIQTWLHPNGIDSDAKKLFSAVETLTGISILAALSRVNSLSQRTANKTQVSIAATELNDRFGAIHPEVAVTALPVAAALADNANETFDQSQLAANETLPIVSEVMTVIYQAIMILTLKLAELQKISMQKSMMQMKETMKPMLITMIPILIIFGWFSTHLAYYPIMPEDQFSVNLTFKDITGTVDILVPNEIDVIGEKTKRPDQVIR